MSIHVSFRQLRLFVALADCRSISGAARACHVTQPTVSMQLRDMTAAVGLPLYEIIGRQLFLTAAGEELATSARSMLAEWDAFEQRSAALRGLGGGRLRVAVVSTAKYFIPRLLGEFCGRHPDIDVSLEVLNRDGVVQRLRENRDDLYIMSRPPADIDVVEQAFMANPLVVIAPIGHPLATARRIPAQRLAAERLILREVGSGTRLACDAHFRKLGVKPKLRLELGSNEAIKQAVAGGLGISILSQHALGDDLAGQGLAVLSAAGFPIHANWFVVHPRGKRLSPLAEAFLHDLREAAGGQSPAPRRRRDGKVQTVAIR